MANVLLVDDEQNVLLTYRTILERGGHRVATASTAEDALSSFENEGADVIVTDMNMPGISGIELVKRVRQKSPGTEIIVMTGAGSERTGIQAMQAGAYDYLKKADIVPDELVLLVEKAAEKSSLQTAIDLRTRIAGLREGFENIIGEDPELLHVLDDGKKSRADRFLRAYLWRVGNRQGTDCRGAACKLPAENEAVRSHQLRGAARRIYRNRNYSAM